MAWRGERNVERDQFGSCTGLSPPASKKFLDGVEGQKCPQLGLAGLVFTEVMQREEQRSDRVELLAARGAHASPQPG